MVKTILTPKRTQQLITPQYQISEAARQAIILRSPLSMRRAKLEQQRVAFIQKNGNEFGQ